MPSCNKNAPRRPRIPAVVRHLADGSYVVTAPGGHRVARLRSGLPHWVARELRRGAAEVAVDILPIMMGGLRIMRPISVAPRGLKNVQ